MTPVAILTIPANQSLTTQGAVHDYVGRLSETHACLRHYQNALVDIVNTKQDELIELYEEAAKYGDYVSSTNGTRLIWMPEIGRAALTDYQSGDWEWTDAASPQDAMRRYHEGDMQP